MPRLPILLKIRILVCLTITALVSCGLTGHAHAQSVQNQFSDFALQIPKQNTEVFAVNNIAGHVESMLRNKALKRVMEEGSLSEFFGVAGANVKMDVALDWLDANRKFFPQTIAITGEDEIYSSTIDIMQLLLRVSMAQATLFDNNFEESDLESLEEEVLNLLDDFKLPAATVWVHWSDKALANQLFSIVKQQVTAVVGQTELRVEDIDSSFTISGKVYDLADETLLAEILPSLGINDKDGEIAAALVEVKFFLEAEVIDSGIRISLGSSPTGKPLATAEDMTGLKDGDSEIAYGRWDGTKLSKAGKEMKDDMDRWAKNGLGKLFRASDTEDMWGNFIQMTSQLKSMSANGQMRAWAVDNQVRVSVQKTGMQAVDSLAGQPILKMLPADAESFAISADRSFGELTLGWLLYFEERIETKSLQKELQGDVEQSAALDWFLASYFDNFGTMREVVRDDLAQIKALPFTVMFDTKGEIEELNYNEVSLASDKFVRMVAISQTDDTDLLSDTLEEIYEEFVKGLLSSVDAEIPKDLKLFQPIEITSGVSGTEFLLNWGSFDSIEFQIKGDFKPHVFVKDDFVFFSTSIDLSREILANKKPFEFKAIQGDAEGAETGAEGTAAVVDHGRIRGVTIGNVYRSLFKMVGQAMLSEQVQVQDLFNKMADGIAEISGIMNHCDWHSTQQDSNRKTLYVLDFQND